MFNFLYYLCECTNIQSSLTKGKEGECWKMV